MTCETRSTSMPRAAMSVATSTPVRPSLTCSACAERVQGRPHRRAGRYRHRGARHRRRPGLACRELRIARRRRKLCPPHRPHRARRRRRTGDPFCDNEKSVICCARSNADAPDACRHRSPQRAGKNAPETAPAAPAQRRGGRRPDDKRSPAPKPPSGQAERRQPPQRQAGKSNGARQQSDARPN